MKSNIKFLLVGILFGVVFIKSEIVSWYHIQEMFRFQSFHMFGVIGSAVAVGIVSLQIIKRFNIKTLDGEVIHLEGKKFNKGFIYGGLLFGVGWALTGACPGPLYGEIGAGYPTAAISLLAAIGGTWVYGYFKEKLPH
jgi:uncharacterized membrane protein YedE/YeeE